VPTSSMAAVTAVDLVKTYPRGRGKPRVRALDGLTVEAAPGSVLALLGPNGAGKSTTVRVLTTLSRPDSGTAYVSGIDVLAHPDAVRRTIGAVWQKASSDPMATGRENLELAARIQGASTAAARARARELLTRFDLTADADRLARTYSGGMARKLDVAIGLVHHPRVLFLDEPTTGLDPQARAQLWREIGRLTGDGVTILLTTHYLDEADRLADRVAIVDRGRIVVEGPPEQLKSELHGDTVQVELSSPEAATSATQALATAGLREAAVEGSRVRARADRPATAVPAVLAALEAAGLTVTAVSVARPSLDDVYLRHVGRAMEVSA